MELYCIISITDRSKAQIMQDLYASCGLHMIFTHLGVGTARRNSLRFPLRHRPQSRLSIWTG